MITCLIADDEPLAVQLLEDYIRQVDFLQLTYKCHTAMEALGYLKHQPVDLLFLDINMPKLTGMELVSLLPPGQKIIFTTAYSAYAVQSYEKNALDYLLKPITFERFMKAVSKAEKWMEATAGEKNNNLSNKMPVFIKSGKSIININLDNVIFVEGLKDYVAFHASNEKTVMYKRMKELEELLPGTFVRIHHSYFINTIHISKIEENQVYASGHCLPISEKYRAGFLQRIKAGLL
jgi:two-component system, LytTR family, response regulator